MDVGLLWLEDEPGLGFDRSVRRVAESYRRKFGRAPSLCFVHPNTLGGRKAPEGDGPLMSGRVEIRVVPWILPNHFWVGIESEGEGARDEPGRD